jgi:hypothetical protein
MGTSTYLSNDPLCFVRGAVSACLIGCTTRKQLPFVGASCASALSDAWRVVSVHAANFGVCEHVHTLNGMAGRHILSRYAQADALEPVYGVGASTDRPICRLLTT